MVKTFEPALKTVNSNKRKWLIRLSQTAMEVGRAPFFLRLRDPYTSRSIAGT